MGGSDRNSSLSSPSVVLAVGVVVGCLFLGALIIGPAVMVSRVTLQGTKDPIEVENEIRDTWSKIFGGMVLFVGAYVSWRAWRSSEEKQRQDMERWQQERITSGFRAATEQLGAEERATRHGGIYALGRIAREEKEEHGAVMEILTGYVRHHAPWPTGDPERDRRSSQKRPDIDIQAVLTVLQRRDPDLDPKDQQLDLQATDLRSADLSGANLEGANLRGANLKRAHLEGAKLKGAHLRGADLSRVRFEKAHLQGAGLSDTILRHAHFEGADLWNAKLSRADLSRAHFDGADLRGTNLKSVTKLDGAGFSGAQYDEGTGWPEGFESEAVRRGAVKCAVRVR